jgi:hypothetical protein
MRIEIAVGDVCAYRDGVRARDIFAADADGGNAKSCAAHKVERAESFDLLKALG